MVIPVTLTINDLSLDLTNEDELINTRAKFLCTIYKVKIMNYF